VISFCAPRSPRWRLLLNLLSLKKKRVVASELDSNHLISEPDRALLFFWNDLSTLVSFALLVCTFFY
jgi:hypothetical protein